MSAPKLTIGLPVYDDHQGVWFTVQSLCLHHADHLRQCELLVVDNNPHLRSDEETPSKQTRGLMERVNGRYVRYDEARGTAPAKNAVFAHAQGDAVLVMDAHVLLAPGAIGRLLDYYEQHPATLDLHHGPLAMDDHRSVITHFDPVWRGEMWGIWGKAWQCPCGWLFTVHHGQRDGRDVAIYHPLTDVWPVRWTMTCPDCGNKLPECGYFGHEPHLEAAGFSEPGRLPNNRPFSIPGNGCGLFTCRREAWLGFCAEARGFGGEEMVIHAKYRAAGRQTWCLPFLRWQHFFGRRGVPYRLDRYDKMRNYVLGFQEIGLDLEPIHDHFITGKGREGETNAPLMPQAYWDYLLADPVGHVLPPHEAQPAPKKTGCGGCGSKAVPDDVTLEDLYDRAAKTPSDLNEHAPKLRELAAGCEQVTEFGHRHNVSSVALLAGQPKTMRVHTAGHDATLTALEKRAGQTDFKVVRGDHLAQDIEPTDLLFIDTRHTADQLYAELSRHVASVRRFIAMHDTAIFGERGEDGGPGLLPAMRRFLRESPQWSVVYHTQANNGLTVLGRLAEDKPSLPSLPRMAWNYAKALATHLAAGKPAAPEPLIDARLDVCATCEQRTDGNRCSVCGCYLDEGPGGRDGKALWLESECPLGKWPDPSGERWIKPECVCGQCGHTWPCGTMSPECPKCGQPPQ